MKQILLLLSFSVALQAAAAYCLAKQPAISSPV
jgi:hypothetical protein